MFSPISAYQEEFQKAQTSFDKFNSQAQGVSLARMLVVAGFVFSLYSAFQTESTVGILICVILSVLSAFVFLFLLRKYAALSFQKKYAKAWMQINSDERRYLEKGELPFPAGTSFIDPSHPYSYDLDFFGERSLFQHLNRTETYRGEQLLAFSLLKGGEKESIEAQQLAIQELAKDLDWRQTLQTFGKLTKDNAEVYNNLIQWSKNPISPQSKVLYWATYILPAVFIAVFTLNEVTNWQLGTWCWVLFFTNLGVMSRQLKTIKKELFVSQKIDQTLKNYSLILEKIESKEFQSAKLRELQGIVKQNGIVASHEIRNLSRLFNQLDNILNPFGAILFNGFLLYHLHVFRRFQIWKSHHAPRISAWLDVIGEMEALNSLANFTYNHPEFAFPLLNDQHKISFANLGHPLLKASQRVTSDISFENQHFIILTGSNMSGKSTFLRSLGVNMVLGSIGAPCCASDAHIHPMPVYVSMRVSDSLNDNESFFFAEVKRLKEVMDAAEKEICFVLLDEILRGTNSDDKRTGTVEVVKKIIAKKAIGAVATHDLKVCETTAEFPQQLMNKCFEVEIVNNELFFDYRLRDGVCKNKSATFLMQKMGVI